MLQKSSTETDILRFLRLRSCKDHCQSRSFCAAGISLQPHPPQRSPAGASTSRGLTSVRPPPTVIAQAQVNHAAQRAARTIRSSKEKPALCLSSRIVDANSRTAEGVETKQQLH